MYTVCMARVNVYLPDQLAEQARLADVNVSAITQEALARKLGVLGFRSWLDRLAELEPVLVPTESVQKALDQGREEFGS
ncbi:type II toxin-antitoxin system CcdA family antitoxin [Candidatus Nanopelagicales bacterium]|nr:type II toxin-antitoxin system CcdA family antitoxin [Candidatus Nanopelagicales bacterium]